MISYQQEPELSATDFLSLVQAVWQGQYNTDAVHSALQKTLNITARDGELLIGCVRILTDGYFFGTIPEILVHPDYQNNGVGSYLLERAKQQSPTSLFFGAQPGNEPFFEKCGFVKGLQSFQYRKPRT